MIEFLSKIEPIRPWRPPVVPPLPPVKPILPPKIINPEKINKLNEKELLILLGVCGIITIAITITAIILFIKKRKENKN